MTADQDTNHRSRPAAGAAPGHPTSPAGTTPAAPVRLPDGAWRHLVCAHLAAYPHTDFSPAELANALGRPKSRGAVINACRRLVADGAARMTRGRPQRFQIAAGTTRSEGPDPEGP